MAKTTPAPGGMELKELIKSMNPILQPEEFVWVAINQGTGDDKQESFLLEAMRHAEMLFREKEGYTAVVTKSLAEKAGVNYVFPCRKITLDVHSSLDAVGFIAAVATRMTSIGCGANVVSGYYHDHLFISNGNENAVMHELRKMAAEQD